MGRGHTAVSFYIPLSWPGLSEEQKETGLHESIQADKKKEEILFGTYGMPAG